MSTPVPARSGGWPDRLLLVGCGNMAGAMLRCWLAAGLPADRVSVVTPSGRAMPHGVTVLPAVPDAADGGFDVIQLGLKPQGLDTLRGGPLAGHAPRLLLSILAGVELATLRPLSAARAVVRAMPNLPVGIGRGVVALHGAGGDAEAKGIAQALMGPLGLVEWTDSEASFDAITALSGCGPGFVFRFIDALAAAGAGLGLPADQALRLARATVDGAAGMALNSSETPEALADRVASPGGSTRQGLDVLDDGDALKRLLEATLAASARRNAEMAAAARPGAA